MSAMENLKVALGDYPPIGEPFIAMQATDRQAIVELLDEVKVFHGDNGYFEISMPCGYSKRFSEYGDIPLEDLPCDCRQEGRYLIKYNEDKCH